MELTWSHQERFKDDSDSADERTKELIQIIKAIACANMLAKRRVFDWLQAIEAISHESSDLVMMWKELIQDDRSMPLIKILELGEEQGEQEEEEAEKATANVGDGEEKPLIRKVERDTLRAFRHHKQVNPLDLPGSADITADVDFAYIRSQVAEIASSKVAIKSY